ncbi:MAG: NUDIX hydrolase [Terriglobales bacterium]
MDLGATLFRCCSRAFVALYGRWPVFGELAGSVAVIRRASGEYLLQWRNDGLGWAFPGGTAWRGEDAEHTLRREVQEETGLSLHSCRLLFTYADRVYFPCSISVFAGQAEGEPRPSWEGRAEWRRLPSEPFFPSHRPILDYLASHEGPL